MRQSVESWLFVEFVRLQIDDDGGIDEAAGPARAALEDFLSARSVHECHQITTIHLTNI